MRHGRHGSDDRNETKHEVRRLKRKVARLEAKAETTAGEMKNLKNQMKQAGLVKRVSDLEQILGGPWV